MLQCRIKINSDAKNSYSAYSLVKYLMLLILIIFSVSCGGGASSNHPVNSSSFSIASSSFSSTSTIEPSVSYKAAGPCAENSAYTLTITGGNLVNQDHLEKMVCNFFTTYPKLVELLNPNAPKNVEFKFTSSWAYPASADGNSIIFSAAYLRGAFNDTDIVVHETTHVAQTELVAGLPRWIIEGTADFVRDLYGLDSKNIWSIPNRYVDGKRPYTNGYGDAAAFFKWIDAVYRQNELPIAAAISRTTLTEPYKDDIWEKLTGKNLETLWYEYMNFPVTPAFTSGVSVFNGENFTGYEVKLERGNYDLTDLLSLGVTDNQIASIKVPDGYKVKAYTGVNFAGEQRIFTSDTPIVDAAMALKISSIVVE